MRFLVLATALSLGLNVATAQSELSLASDSLRVGATTLTACGQVDLCDALGVNSLTPVVQEFDPASDFGAVDQEGGAALWVRELGDSVYVITCGGRNLCAADAIASLEPSTDVESTGWSVLTPTGAEALRVDLAGRLYSCGGVNLCAAIPTRSPTPRPTTSVSPSPTPLLTRIPTPMPTPTAAQPDCPSWQTGIGHLAAGLEIRVAPGEFLELQSIEYNNAQTWSNVATLWINNDVAATETGVVQWSANAPTAAGSHTIPVNTVLPPGTWYLRAKIPYGVPGYAGYASFGQFASVSDTFYPYPLVPGLSTEVVQYAYLNGNGVPRSGNTAVFCFCNLVAVASTPLPPTPGPTPVPFQTCPSFADAYGVGAWTSGMVVEVNEAIVFDSFVYANSQAFPHVATLWLNTVDSDPQLSPLWSATAPQSVGPHTLFPNVELAPGSYYLRALIPDEVEPNTVVAYGALETVGNDWFPQPLNNVDAAVTHFSRIDQAYGVPESGLGVLYHFCELTAHRQ